MFSEPGPYAWVTGDIDPGMPPFSRSTGDDESWKWCSQTPGIFPLQSVIHRDTFDHMTKRSEIVHMRVTPEEQALLRAKAEEQGMPISMFIRRLVFAQLMPKVKGGAK